MADQGESLFILKSRPETLKAAEDFLRNRGWQINQALTVKSALTIIMSTKPQFVMLSVDNPFPKIRTLPSLISQSFPETEIILFAENSSTQSFNALKDWGIDYTLYPPISGPAIERLIARIRRDAERAKQIQIQNANAGSGDSTLIRHANSANNLISIRGSKRVGSPDEVEQARRALAGLVNTDGVKHAKFSFVDQAEEPKERGGLVFGRGRFQRERAPDESIIAIGTQEALEQSVELSVVDSIEAIAATTRVACIQVNSDFVSGYLLAAFGSDREVDCALIEMVRVRLLEFMKENDTSFSTEDALEFDLKEVPFESWAEGQGDFLRKSVHRGQEIAMAFFPFVVPDRALEISGEETMLMLNMDEIVGDAKVDFDLYVYLPTNHKYILYTRKGNRLPLDQRDRLNLKGVSKMHLRKEAKPDVKRYRVRNYLNKKIEAFAHLTAEARKSVGGD